MCHDSWFKRMREEREASRELWDEFERTRPLSDPMPADDDVEIKLEHPQAEPVAAEE